MKKIGQTKIFPKDGLSIKAVKQQVEALVIDKTIKLGLKIGFVGLGLSWLVLAVKFYKLPPEVPLLYSRPYGEAQLVSAWGLWLVPGLSSLIELIMIRISGNVVEEDKLLAQILIWAGGLMVVMGLIGLIKVIWLVT